MAESFLHFVVFVVACESAVVWWCRSFCSQVLQKRRLLCHNTEHKFSQKKNRQESSRSARKEFMFWVPKEKSQVSICLSLSSSQQKKKKKKTLENLTFDIYAWVASKTRDSLSRRVNYKSLNKQIKV